MELLARFYVTDAGNDPVRDWFKALNKADKVAMGKAVQRVQIGWPVGRPLCGSLGGGLYEVRQDLSDNRTGRVLFCFAEKQRSCCSMRSSRRPRRSRKLSSTWRAGA